MAGHQRVVLAGEFGFGNYGAEADLVVLSKRLREESGGEPVALSASPAETSRIYRMRALHLFGLRGIIAWLTAGHAVIAGGQNFDSTLYRRRNWLSPYLTGLILLRALLGKRSQLRAVGVYEVSRLPRLLLRLALKYCNRITARDAPSERVLRSLAGDVARREPCPARAIVPAAPETVEGLLAAEKVPGGKQPIGFSLRRTNDADKDRKLIAAVAEVAEWCVSEHGLHVLFIPSCQHKYKKSENDAVFMREILSSVAHQEGISLLIGRYGPDVIAGICAQTIGVVTSRHHVIALCDAVGTDSLALDIAEKMEAYLSEQGRGGSAISLYGDVTAALKKKILGWLHASSGGDLKHNGGVNPADREVE